MRCLLTDLVVSFAIICAAEAQQPLQVAQTQESIIVRGDHFSATWRRDAAWQLASVQIEDFEGAFTIDGKRDDIRGIGALVIRCSGTDYFAWRGAADTPQFLAQSEDHLLFTVAVTPRSADGRPCPLHIRQEFSVFGEGAVFCDFTLVPATGAEQTVIDDVELGTALNTAELQYLRWHWKQGLRGNEDLAREVSFRFPQYLRVLGATVGRQRPYTNHVDMFLEEKKSLTGDGEEGMWCEVSDDSGAAKRFCWHLGAPVQANHEFSYTNRWGIALGHFRLNDNAVGQRVAHWQEGNAHLMTYPSDSAIKAMAECGVSICVLHLYWSRDGWGNYEPFDEEDMRRWVRTCHNYGIKCIAYAVPADRPGTKGVNKEWIRDLNLDGIFFDSGSVHWRYMQPGGAIGGFGREFPALDFLKLTRHYRDAVGPEGILISHAGGTAPDVLYHLNMNAYLAGEWRTQAAMLDDFRAAAYHNGVGYAVAHPWCEYEPFQTRHAAATFCAVGGFPHILCGRGTHQNNNYHRSVYRSADFVLPYWQILSTIPMDRTTTLYTETAAPAARATQPLVYCCVYQRSPDLLLVTVANLGEPCSPVITLNEELLQIRGTYRLLQLGGRDMAEFEVADLGSWRSGPIELGMLGKDDYVGLLLTCGQLPRYTSAALARIERLVAAFNDREPPTTPSGLAASRAPGVVKLSWQPATDEFHVVEYRLYRGTDEAPLALLAAVEESIEYSDYTAPMGVSLRYAVSAVDVAGNEGPKSKPVRVRSPGREITIDSLIPVNGYWEQDGEYLRQGFTRAPATSEGATITFPTTTAQFVRVYFTGGLLNNNNAHVVEMKVHDEKGREIEPVNVTSSGSDPGHPEAAAADGITDDVRNGWWSDRNRGLPAWLAFDLGKPHTVSSVWLLTYWDGKRLYDYSIQLSPDGRDWTGVASGPGAVTNARALADVEFADGIAGVTTLELDMQRSGGGLLFRCPDSNNGYALYLDEVWDGNLVLAKLVDGKLQRLKSAFFPYSLHNPIPHRLSVTCQGATLKCYCDEVLAFEVTDDTFSHGQVGLIVPTGHQLKFMNLLVAP